MRQSDGKTLDIGVVQPVSSPLPDPGGYADAAAQDKFCANTYCWITTIYDQSPRHNDLTQAPRGGFNGPALGGLDNLPLADMAPVTVMGHKVYGVFIEPGMGLRNDDPRGTAVDDQAEGQYWIVSGLHFNGGCCFDYGNVETDSHDDDNGTMEAAYFGDNAGPWFHGKGAGPWIMTDQENNLVGCVNSDGTKACKNLPTITWPFVTAIAKGEPHHWTSMGGNAEQGALAVMFSGPRVNFTYDPMRKQGAIVLGNGGDNSNSSQGTFYEGAMTAAGTFPSDATDQRVQANIVAARYRALPLRLTPASATSTPPGLQTFFPGSSQDSTVTFTNTTGAAAADLTLSVVLPNDQWTAIVQSTSKSSKTFTTPVAPGASVSATFHITSGPAFFNGDLVGKAAWTDQTSGVKRSETVAEKVRNVSPIKINEFRTSSGSPVNATNSFIELYNAGPRSVDLSNWTLTVRPTQQAIFSTINIPAGTKLAAHGFYLLGLSNSGLAVQAHAGETTIYLRNTDEMSVGDTISIGSGSAAETRRIASIGTAADQPTTVWQPLPDGPIITVPAGSTNIPVTEVHGFAIGQKIALGYGATYPDVERTSERYEIATVVQVGKPGTQAYLGADAPAGATNIKVTSVSNISVGDRIRLDIDSLGHGIETVTVTHVGTPALRTTLASEAAVGSTNIKVADLSGFTTGDKMTIGTPVNWQTVTITAVGTAGAAGSGVDFSPALTQAYPRETRVTDQGTGLDLAEPLRFRHADNLPFSDRGTGISFQPPTSFAHSSNEPILPLGTGITLDRPLENDHPIDAVVRDASVTTAGYQGTPSPDQWFGGPALTTNETLFERYHLTLHEGSIVLRDASGLTVDSLNYGALVDPWAAEGYQGASGPDASGCYAPAPDRSSGFEQGERAPASNISTGRISDGEDTDSNCIDFATQSAANLAEASAMGATNIKVTRTKGFRADQKIMIGTGADMETAVITSVGGAGATTTRAATNPGAIVIPVTGAIGFQRNQTITIDRGANAETAIIASIRRSGGHAAITVVAPLTRAHAANAEVSGTGITLASALKRAHAAGVQVSDNAPTPGAANHYDPMRP